MASAAPQSTTQLSSLSSGLVYTLAASRFAAGAACVFAPSTMSGVMQMESLPGVTLLARTFGVREAAVGGLTVLTLNKPESTKDLRRIIWTGIAVDTFDVISCLMVLASSDSTAMDLAAAKSTGGMGFCCILVGLYAIKSLGSL
ncbi:unnamed protein product [Clonostachys rosea f. rosea IK726]|jgi:hypothetical protein|uniref:Uncharacterized protein n=1 Tax=Clonostachys rosea f. rosea IK726 TaxID=1349383 RepID=A0ACA9UNM2_BIOOC|nr:unnamed protein product [Clonostachys rosea f. rosea IK726]